ncbi:hypothetical protein EJ110_NYTH35834 [Nymphaea thermarum]|nr:hypothetical protein EJ110_NYTH35834 [Nymphaea thermarum]
MFKKFSFRGVDLDAFLDMPTEELVPERFEEEADGIDQETEQAAASIVFKNFGVGKRQLPLQSPENSYGWSCAASVIKRRRTASSRPGATHAVGWPAREPQSSIVGSQPSEEEEGIGKAGRGVREEHRPAWGQCRGRPLWRQNGLGPSFRVTTGDHPPPSCRFLRSVSEGTGRGTREVGSLDSGTQLSVVGRPCRYPPMAFPLPPLPFSPFFHHA